MTSQEIQAKCKEYREMKRIAEEAQLVADSIADELKALVSEHERETGENKMIVGEYKLSYADRKRTDINKKALQEAQPEVYAAYLTETSYKVFTVR